MSARDELWGAVRLAATYHADEGTAGWLLSEQQFEAIVAAADEYRAEGLLSLATELEDKARCLHEADPAVLALAEAIAGADAATAGHMLRKAARLARVKAGESPS